MAQQYDNEKRIALFPNDKGGNEKRPDYRGKLTLNGVDYKISLWSKTGPKGPYMAGQFEVDAKPSAPAPAAAPAPAPIQPRAAAPTQAETEDIAF